MKKILFSVWLCLCLIPTAHANLGLEELQGVYGQYKPKEKLMDPAARERRIKTLKKGLTDIELYWNMNNFNNWQHEKSCREEYVIMRDTYEEAERLDRQKDNPTEEYRKGLREAKNQNEMARREFKKCFNYSLRKDNLDDFNKVGVKDYDSFLAIHRKMRKRFDSKDTSALYEKYRQELKQLTEFEHDPGTIGRLESVFKGVEVFRGGKWIPAKEGMVMYVQDKIRTSGRGRARMEFNDYHRGNNSGPTIINIGSNSEILMEKFKTSFTDDPPRREGVVDLIRGVVRAFTKNWGFRSAFNVRTGTSLCGIRGTDVMISYDPGADQVNYLLNHGKVDISTPSKKLSLTDRQSLSVSKGQAGQVGKLKQTVWLNAVTNTNSRGSNLLGKGANKNESSAILEGINEALTAFKYRRPKELVTYTTGRYDWLRDAVKTTRGINEIPNIPVEWTPLCLGECTTPTECKVYTSIQYDNVEGNPPIPEIILIARKEDGVWKMADFITTSKDANRKEYDQQVKACGL